jgi:tetratricopeptide (TPR) repeat protein
VPPESFLPNLVLFACGQAAACIYLRTGRFGLGVGSTVSLWVLADWALVGKLVYGETGERFLVPLVGMQAVAVATIVALAFGLWRARWSATSKQRPALFAAGLEQYLRDDLDAAEKTFRRLVRADPWDAAAWVTLGNVLRGKGRTSAARRCYRRARCVDKNRQYADFITMQQQRVRERKPPLAMPAPVTAVGSRQPVPRSHPAGS